MNHEIAEIKWSFRIVHRAQAVFLCLQQYMKQCAQWSKPRRNISTETFFFSHGLNHQTTFSAAINHCRLQFYSRITYSLYVIHFGIQFVNLTFAFLCLLSIILARFLSELSYQWYIWLHWQSQFWVIEDCLTGHGAAQCS